MPTPSCYPDVLGLAVGLEPTVTKVNLDQGYLTSHILFCFQGDPGGLRIPPESPLRIISFLNSNVGFYI